METRQEKEAAEKIWPLIAPPAVRPASLVKGEKALLRIVAAPST